MKNKFLELPKETRINIFNRVADQLGITPFAAEKDWWVTRTLSIIFEMENVAPHLVFKGGTSLSKAWNLIERFSEDVDLAIDRAYLGFDEIPTRYAKATVCVFPSHMETLGLVALEAMAMEKPFPPTGSSSTFLY